MANGGGRKDKLKPCCESTSFRSSSSALSTAHSLQKAGFVIPYSNCTPWHTRIKAIRQTVAGTRYRGFHNVDKAALPAYAGCSNLCTLPELPAGAPSQSGLTRIAGCLASSLAPCVCAHSQTLFFTTCFLFLPACFYFCIRTFHFHTRTHPNKTLLIQMSQRARANSRSSWHSSMQSNVTPTRMDPPAFENRRSTLGGASATLGRTATISTLPSRYRTPLANTQLPQPATQHSGSPWGSSRTASPAVRGARDRAQTVGRQFSEASYTPTIPRRINARGSTHMAPISQVFASSNSNSGTFTFRKNSDSGSSRVVQEQFPQPHYSNINGYDNGAGAQQHLVDMQAAAYARPESRGSMYSATSASTFTATQQYYSQANASGSGKAPLLVSSLKLDAKVVPPDLDQHKAKRRRLRAGHSAEPIADSGQGGQQKAPAPRIRVRMDVAVHVLHQGEQSVDLLCVGEPRMSQSLLRGMGDRQHSSLLKNGDFNANRWPRIERADFTVAGAGEYAESAAPSLPTSPVSSPSLGQQTLTLPPDEQLRSENIAADWLASTPAPVPVVRTPSRKSDARTHTRTPPVFHVNQVSPYPPPPPPLLATSQTNSSSLSSDGAVSGVEPQPAAAHYESHTMASYSRARARASDRVAIYSDLASSPSNPSLLSRRTQSFNDEVTYNQATGLLNRPISAMDEMYSPPGAPLDASRSNATGTAPRYSPFHGSASTASLAHRFDRPHSSMGFVNRRARANSGASAAASAHTSSAFVDGSNSDRAPGLTRQHPDLQPGSMQLNGETAAAVPQPPARAETPQPNTESAPALTTVNEAPLCEFEIDSSRGMFVARLREPRRYRLTVWFYVPADISSSSSEHGVSVESTGEVSPGVKRPAAHAMTIYPWESGTMSLSGLPRSLHTRVRVRLPHRHTLLDHSGNDSGDQNDLVLLDFAGDRQPQRQHEQTDDLATPRRQLMKVAMDDVPSSIRMAGISRPALSSVVPLSPPANDSTQQSPLGTTGLPGGTYGCFYRVKMTQPSHVEPQSSRAVDARMASLAAASMERSRSRESDMLLSPTPQPSALLSAPFIGEHAAHEERAAGWLNTDDSDAAEQDGSAFGLSGGHGECLDEDAESVLDRKLQRFIEEYGRRDTFGHDPQPDLVGSDGRLGANDMFGLRSVPNQDTSTSVHVDDFGSPIPANQSSDHAVFDCSSNRQGLWASFAKDQAQSEGFDYQKTELTVFKLKSVDSISIAWSPRLLEYCRPVSSGAPVTEQMVPDTDMLNGSTQPQIELSDADEPLLPRFGLETILSAASTPNSTVRGKSSAQTPNPGLLPPDEQSATAAVDSGPNSAPPQDDTAARAAPLIDSVVTRIVVQPEGLQVLTSVTLSTGRECKSSSAVLDSHTAWPEFIDLQFAPLLLAVPGGGGGTASGSPFVGNVGLHHQSVNTSCGDVPVPCRWTSEAPQGVKLSGPLPSSPLRVWVPPSASNTSVVTLEVASALERQILPRGMMLTERLYIAIPQGTVSLPALQLATAETPAKPLLTGNASVSVVNNAGLWVRASLVESDNSLSELLSLLSASDYRSHHIALIERLPSTLASTQMSRLIAATNELGWTAMPYSCAVDLDVVVSVRSDGSGRPDSEQANASGLAVCASMSCSVASFMPWCMQPTTAGPETAEVTPCLAIRIPAIGGANRWAVDKLEVQTTGSQCSTLGHLLSSATEVIVLPIRPARSPGAELGDEVIVDVVKCEFSTHISAGDLPEQTALSLPLPLPLLDPTDQQISEAVDASIQRSHMRFARLSNNLLSGVSVSLYAPHSTGDALRPSQIDSCTVVCPLDTARISDSAPLVEHRFTLDSCSYATPLKLNLVAAAAPIEESKPLLATTYVETDHREESIVSKVTDGPKPHLPGSAPTTDTCSDADLPINGSSLQNGHAVQQTEQHAPPSLLLSPPLSSEPPAESDPLLPAREQHPDGPEEEMSTTVGAKAWRVMKLLLRATAFLLVALLAVLFAAEYLEMPLDAQIKAALPEYRHLGAFDGTAIESAASGTAPPLSVDATAVTGATTLAPAATTAEQQPPVHISVVGAATLAPTQYPRSVKVRLRSKGDARQGLETEALSSSDGAHSFPPTHSPFGWVYYSVVEPLLSILNSFF
ncbi:hypothetical protein GQ54DRAFT_306450 [Martensiomyces pterosporus]|nr:hypothetical protein GQ54DRAFT_306450 [Martensiomyces pterosporus]